MNSSPLHELFSFPLQRVVLNHEIIHSYSIFLLRVKSFCFRQSDNYFCIAISLISKPVPKKCNSQLERLVAFQKADDNCYRLKAMFKKLPILPAGNQCHA